MELEELKKIKEWCNGVDILCVEDDFELRNSLVTLLSNFFNNIYVAGDGLEALRLYSERKGGFELILTDINMPNLNGVEFIEEVKKRNPAQKFVVLSAHDDDGYIRRLEEAGVDGFLRKPAKLEDFVKLVLRLMIEGRAES